MHSSLNLECSTTTMKKHGETFTESSTKSSWDGGSFLTKECFGDHKPDFKPDTKQGIIGIEVLQLSKNLLNGHIHLPKEKLLVNPCFIQNLIYKE